MSLLGRLHRTLIYGRRVRRLADLLSRMIPNVDNLLDIGSGDGKLAWHILQNRPELRIQGIDVLQRKQSWISVQLFNGETLPYEDSSFDAVMLVDVLHHVLEPLALLKETVRVSRRWLIVKDHVLTGPVAGVLLRMMDYAGNADHHVPLPYNYISKREWKEFERTLGVRVVSNKEYLGLYSWPLDYVFGSDLHFISVYEKGSQEDRDSVSEKKS